MGNSIGSDPSSAPGKTINLHGKNLKIIRQLGEGGFAYVFEVFDVATGASYALKRILAQDRESVELADMEIKIMRECKSPNIVDYLDSTKIMHPKSDGKRSCVEYLILMEYCSGGTLHNFIEHQVSKLAEMKVLRMFSDVVSAVEALHCRNPPTCHRDLKLENLLLSSNQILKLCDFGSCTTRSKAYVTKEEIGREEDRIQMYTTSSYRSPEMVDLWTRQVVGVKADIWALGCILYSIAFLKHPFQDGSGLSIVHSQVKIPRHSGFSKGFETLLSRLFALKYHKDALYQERVSHSIEYRPDDRPDIFEVKKLVARLKSGRSIESHDDHRGHSASKDAARKANRAKGAGYKHRKKSSVTRRSKNRRRSLEAPLSDSEASVDSSNVIDCVPRTDANRSLSSVGHVQVSSEASVSSGTERRRRRKARKEKKALKALQREKRREAKRHLKEQRRQQQGQRGQGDFADFNVSSLPDASSMYGDNGWVSFGDASTTAASNTAVPDAGDKLIDLLSMLTPTSPAPETQPNPFVFDPMAASSQARQQSRTSISNLQQASPYLMPMGAVAPSMPLQTAPVLMPPVQPMPYPMRQPQQPQQQQQAQARFSNRYPAAVVRAPKPDPNTDNNNNAGDWVAF